MGLTEQQKLVLEYHNYQLPCIFEFAIPECTVQASWLVDIGHLIPNEDCPDDGNIPMCDQHKKLAEQTFIGFWSMWRPGPKACPNCHEELALNGMEPITKGG